MTIALVLVRLLLAGLFLLAGLTKLAGRNASVAALQEFGLPGPLARPAAWLLPLAELMVVGLLLAPTSPLPGGAGALTLLTVFTIAIVVNLVRGRKPDCHCFGQLHSAPVGWSTVLRNVAFGSAAALLFWQGTQAAEASVSTALRSAWAQAAAFHPLLAALAAAMFAMQSWLLVHAMRQHGRLLVRIETLEHLLRQAGLLAEDPASTHPGLPVGSPAPDFDLPALSGEGPVSLDRLLVPGKSLLLLFTDPECKSCSALLPELALWERDFAAALTIALISRGTPEANRAKAGPYRLKNLLLQRDREVAELYYATATPSAVLIDDRGLVRSTLAMGATAIAQLVSEVPSPRAIPAHANGNPHLPSAPAMPQSLAVGTKVPDFVLPRLEGGTMTSAELRGSDTLVLFWNPKCGFCNRMLPELADWEQGRSDSAPNLLLISTGDEEAHRAMQLESPILLDRTRTVGVLFGAMGTPSAVLVDSTGRIASRLAVGAPSVMALAAESVPVNSSAVAG